VGICIPSLDNHSDQVSPLLYMPHPYIALHFSRNTLFFFPADSLEAAHQHLVGQLQAGLTTPRDTMAVASGITDEVIYFKEAQNNLASLAALVETAR
jgi:hypothetical protein